MTAAIGELSGIPWCAELPPAFPREFPRPEHSIDTQIQTIVKGHLSFFCAVAQKVRPLKPYGQI
jgi:hypothetical protein